MRFEMPDINKIREELDKNNPEVNEEERNRVKEEYERLSKGEKPTEELIKEEKDKREDPDENIEEGAKKGIKDENIIQKLTSENVKAAAIFKAAYEKGKFIEVKIKGPSGEMEDGWVINKIDPKTGEVTVLKSTSEKGKDESFIDKTVTLEELKEWNKPETKESKEKEKDEENEKKDRVEDIKLEKTAINKEDTDKILNGTKGQRKEKEKSDEEKRKENLEKEITKRYYDQLEAIKKMPDNTGILKQEKTEKYFQLIKSWKNSAYLDSYKGINKIFSELDALKPSMFFYNLKKANTIDNVAITMALNHEKWNIKDKEKIKIIENFIDERSKEKNIWYQSADKDCTFQEITKILALKDIPFKGNLDIIIKNIENQNIKSKTIAEMIDIKEKSTKEKEQLLKETKEKITKEESSPEAKIKKLLEKMGVNASEEIIKFFEGIDSLTENSDIKEKFQKVIDTKEFKEFNSCVKKITKEKKEIPEAVAKTKEHIEKKESGWGTAFGAAGWFVTLILMLFIGILMRGEDYFIGQAVGGKKK